MHQEIHQAFSIHQEIHQAFSSLPSREIERIISLIQVLKQIDCIDNRFDTNRIAYRAITYLEHRLEDLENNRRPLEIADTGPANPSDGVWLHTQVVRLSPNRKRELIELGCFLRGDFFTSERTGNLKRILRSYLKAIEYSQGLQSSK